MVNQVERRNNCPACNSKFLATDTIDVYCLTCMWKTKAKREVDKELPQMKDIQREWR
jgi:transcriptional regulator NrdR family protein